MKIEDNEVNSIEEKIKQQEMKIQAKIKKMVVMEANEKIYLPKLIITEEETWLVRYDRPDRTSKPH